MTHHNDDLARKALSLAGIGKWEFILEKQLIYFSDVAQNMLGVADESLLSCEIIGKWIHPNDFSAFRILKENLENGKPGALEVRFTLPTGQTKVLLLQGEPIVEETKVIGHFGIMKDLTEVRQTEDNFKHIKTSLQEATHLLNFGCLDFNLKEHTGTWIAQLHGFFSLGKNDPLTMPIDQIVSPVITFDRDRLRAAIYETLNSGVLNCEYRIVKPNGEKRLMRVNGVLYDNYHVMAFTTDITEVRNLQLKSQEIEKMNLVANMSAAVAHEILNPLTSILGFIKLIEKRISNEEAKSFLDVVQQEALQIKEITSELLVLAKPQATKYQMCNVKQVLKSVLPLVRAQANMNTVELDCTLPDVPEIHAEPNHLRQVFVNVTKNALEAMQDGGKLTISLKQQLNDVIIVFEDQGKGIPSDVLDRIGEPYYSTKEKGTGLGVMVAKRIVEDHNGRIAYESKEKVGTRVTITLPIKIKQTRLEPV